MVSARKINISGHFDNVENQRNGYEVCIVPAGIPMFFAGKVVLDGPDGHTVHLLASLRRPGGLHGVDPVVRVHRKRFTIAPTRSR